MADGRGCPPTTRRRRRARWRRRLRPVVTRLSRATPPASSTRTVVHLTERVEVRLHVVDRRNLCAQLLPELWVRRRALHHRRKVEGVATAEMEAVDTRRHLLRHATDVAADHRSSMEECFLDDEGRVLPPDRRH